MSDDIKHHISVYKKVFLGLLILTFLTVNLIYAVAGSSTLIVAGLAFYIKDIKATPMAIIRLPIKTYRVAVRGRNWLLTKINYLNEELICPKKLI